MKTPSKYWRIACPLDEETPLPSSTFALPPSIAAHAGPPTAGHGLLLAAYDEEARTGIVRYLGTVTSARGAIVTVNWQPVRSEIWVDSSSGHGFWKNQPAFAFAKAKVPTYGLAEIFAQTFLDMNLPEAALGEDKPVQKEAGFRIMRPGRIAPERLNPIEVIGEPTASPRGGVVYVLKSKYGYKIGRTKNIPARMRAFGVLLPFLYTIELCAWFDDAVVAEKRYHEMFRGKRLEGEWFELEDHDIQRIRAREAA